MSIESKLKGYLEKKSRIMVLDLKIEKAERELELCNNEYAEPDKEAIEGMQMSAVDYTKDKISSTNKFSSATENTAINYHNELVTSNDLDAMQIKIDIKVWEKEKGGLEDEIKVIEAALKSLTKEEDFIITCLYIEKQYWSQILNNYPRNFNNQFKSERTLRDIKRAAEEKFLRVIA